MNDFAWDELADRAGVPVAYVERLIELGIVRPADTERPVSSAGDVRRVRFVRTLEEGGLGLDGIGAAVTDGDLSFAFLDSPAWERFGGLVPMTYLDVSATTGIDVEDLRTIREAMGFARPSPDERLRDDEVVVVEWLKACVDAGADVGATERMLRVWGESARHIAEAGSQWFHDQIEVPRLRAGMSEAEVVQAGARAASGFAALVDKAIAAVVHAQTEHTWTASKVEAVEAALERVGVSRIETRHPAICFVDLAGYTRLTEERGDAAAAEIAAALGTLVRRSAQEHGGRPVKWLGDGVMLHFRDPKAAVLFALEIVDRVSAEGLPPAHVGVDTGPVIVRDGDYFGRTVNIAARIAAHATAGQVLVSGDVVRATTSAGVAFSDVGVVELKGLSSPVRLHSAHHQSSS